MVKQGPLPGPFYSSTLAVTGIGYGSTLALNRLSLQKKGLKKISPYLPAISWLIITTILLCLPGSSLPKENWLSRLWVDKWVHFLLFMVLVVLWCRGITKQGTYPSLQRLFIYLGLLAILYGFIMELIQGNYIPNRSFDMGDLAADAVGGVAGILFSSHRYIKK